MRLINFKATNVHKYLNFDLTFFDDITFLIGINGSGKTSVLKLILGLITPSYKYINQIEFDNAELTFGPNIETPNTKITAVKKSDQEIEITLITASNPPLVGILMKPEPQFYETERNVEMITERMKTFETMFESQEIQKEIQKITTPLFLGLDRRVGDVDKIDKISAYRASYYRRKSSPVLFQNDILNRSLLDLQSVIFDYYRNIAAKQNRYNEEFKNKILALSFDFVEENNFNLKTDYRDILVKKDQVLKAIETLAVKNLNYKINDFFDKLTTLLRVIQDFPKNDKSDRFVKLWQNWFSNQPQLKRIDEIITYSLSYQQQVNDLYEPVDRLKNLVDKFFKEGHKELKITPEGELQIFFIKPRISSTCYELSSGEKQVLTMIGHLVFFEENFKKESGIFIIDEPEVSLHLAWQEIFVDAIRESSPKTQFILATHSPAIVANYNEDNCQDLAKLN